MKNHDVAKTYARILTKYLTKFGLEPIDIAFLIKTKKDVIDGLLTGKRGVVLKTLDKIAQLFGLTYYEFGNPEHPVPPLTSIPQRTKDRIAYRKKVGPYIEETYNSLDINEKITIALSYYKEKDEFLIEELATLINEKCADNVIPSLISDRFSKTFSAYVQKTNKKGRSKSGRGRRPYYFKLVKELPPQMVNLAKETIGNKWAKD